MSKVVERTLVCFDFDLTLTDMHMFRAVTQLIQAGESRDKACMRGISYLDQKGARGGGALWDVLTALLSQGHGIAVCSFTSYPELPMALLQRGVKELRARGASREATAWLSRPIVTYGDPNPKLRPSILVSGAHLVEVSIPQMSEVGKQRHILQALEVAHNRLQKALRSQGVSGGRSLIPPPSGDPSEPFSRVILVDDDERNVLIAREAGYEGIVAPAPGEEGGGDTHLQELSDLLSL